MKILTAAAGLAALLAGTGAAMAVPVHGSTPMPQQPSGFHRAQTASNRNLQVASRHVETAIDHLNRDARDYGGHKEHAVDDLVAARQDLAQALSFWQSHHNRNSVSGNSMSGRPMPAGNGEFTGTNMSNQRASNESLTDARRNIEAAIDGLNRDATDYGGFKEKAVDRLSAARSELDAALDFIRGAQNGGTGNGVSDANLRFVDGHIQSAISQLQGDRHDYGGHRVAAINDLQLANSDINAALAFDATHRNSTSVGAGPIPPQPALGSIGQGASNRSLANARQHVEAAIDALSRDAHDYGGYRVKAIAHLRAARSELLQALNFQ